MGKVVSLILATLFCLANIKISIAQTNAHVKWTHKINLVSPNEVVLILNAEVEPLWHIYSQYLNEGGPPPTRIKFDLMDAYLLSGKIKESGKFNTYYDTLYEMEITSYYGVVSFIQRLKIIDPSVVLKCEVDYLLCNHEICIPSTHQFNVSVDDDIKKQ